jgi:ribosomal protein S18 acetylase RimI-like enzyme
MMQSGNAGFYHPLDPEECRILADALGDTPETVDSVHKLRRGMCKAYVAGEPSRFDGAIVQADDWPTGLTGFGSDPQVLWELLKAVEGWECVLLDSGRAPVLGEIIEQEMEVRVRYLDDVCHILAKPVLTFRDEAVRQLGLADLELLESAAPEFTASYWPSHRALLSEGIIACAIISRQVVAAALTAGRSDRYADVGVYTHKDFRCRGFATAAASVVAERVQEAGQTPVWSTDEHNTPSLRVARKLGFSEVSRRTYVLLDRG